MIDKHLPSFFIVGVQKAGTTSIHDWLVQQPDIRLPIQKETHFFSDDDRYANGVDWYINQFPLSRSNTIYEVTGEIDPEYAFYSNAPIRIKSFIKKPKIIFIFRNPIERAFSQYNMSVYRGFEHLSFPDALIEENNRMYHPDDGFTFRHYSYLSRSKYTEQVQRYFSCFPDSSFLFIRFDDLISSSRGNQTYDEICQFIGLKSDSKIADRSKISNPSGMPKFIFLRNLIFKKSLLRSTVGKIIHSKYYRAKIKYSINQWNFKKDKHEKNHRLNYQELPDFAIETALKEIKNLQKITRLNLQAWLDKFE
jgi:hypothetical protein